MNIENFYSCTFFSFPQGMCTITKTCYKISCQQKTSTNKNLKTCYRQFEKKRLTTRTMKQENAGGAAKCTSVHVPTSHHKCKMGLGEPTDKAYPSTRDRGWGALAVLADRSKRSQTGITVHNTCTKTHKTGVFFFSPLSLSFSKEGCTRACMGQLEHRPCALCHYNSRASEELVWLRRRGERSPAADTTLLRRKGTKHLPAWQCSHRNLQSLATVVLAIMNAKCHSLTPEE